MERKMSPIGFLKRKFLDFLVPYIEGSSKKEEVKNKNKNKING